MKITEEQENFIWLAHAEGKPFSEIEKQLNISRATLSQWERDLRPLWQEVSAIKKVHVEKKITLNFKMFHNWFKSMEQNRKCFYCGITEQQIETLMDSKKIQTKRLRGRKLELDRKDPDLSYDVLDNIVYACYWCNNAKTDTFTHDEFLEIGDIISKIWKQRMEK